MMKPRFPASQSTKNFLLSRSQAEKKKQSQCRECPFSPASSACRMSSYACLHHEEDTTRRMSTAQKRMQFHLDLSGWPVKIRNQTLGLRLEAQMHGQNQGQRRFISSQSPPKDKKTETPSKDGNTEIGASETEKKNAGDEVKGTGQSQAHPEDKTSSDATLPNTQPQTPPPSPSSTSSSLTPDSTTGQLSHVTTLSSDPTPPSNGAQQSRLYHTINALAHTSRSRFRVLADKYNESQSKRPNLTQLLCTLVIYFFGDVCAQMVALSGDDEQEEEEEEEGAKTEQKEKQGYDPVRTIRHLMVGGMLAVPNWKWFMFLHYHFNFRSVSLSILTKVSISQIVYTPIFNTYFFAAQSLLAGNNITDTIDRVINAVPVSVVNSVMVWPAVTGLTFLYVQPQYRSLFSGVVAIGWQTYLSWLNSKAAKEVSMERVEEKGKEKMVEAVDLDLAGRRVAAAS